MRKTIRGFPLTLLLLLAALCLMACGSTKVATTSKSEAMTEVVQEVASAVIQAETAHAEQQSVQQQVETQLTTTKQEESESVPAEMSSLTVPTQNLLDLPDGASYNASEGRSTVSATRKGNNIVLEGKCGSLERRVRSYEQTVFRQCSTIDSLTNVILAQQDTIAKYEAEEVARSAVTEEVEQTVKKPSNWHKWLFGGVLLGVALSIAACVLWKRTRFGLIVKTVISKITRLWQK